MRTNIDPVSIPQISRFRLKARKMYLMRDCHGNLHVIRKTRRGFVDLGLKAELISVGDEFAGSAFFGPITLKRGTR